MKLHFTQSGQGSPIIILHGLYGASDNWAGIAKVLSTQMEVYRVDLRNHGRSFHHSDFSIRQLTDDLFEFIQSNGLENVTLLGHSLGGKVVMQFTLEYPKLVANLIVADIAPTFVPERHSAIYNFHKQLIVDLCSVNLSKANTRADIDQQLAAFIDDGLLRQFFLKNIKKTTNTFEWKFNLESIKNNINKIVCGSVVGSNGDKKIHQATLFLKGEQSEYLQTDDINNIYNLFDNVLIETIPNSTHWLHAENPELFSNLVMRFLQSKVVVPECV